MRHFLRSTRSTWFKLMKATSRTKPTAEADIMPVLLVSVALGGTFLLARRRTDMTTASRISPRDMQYLCEGSSNLLCKAKSDGYVLQFKKDVCKDRTSQMIDLERHRLMQQFLARWFAGSNVSVPEILSVPASDVRAVDAHILASRSKAVRKERLDVGSDIRVMLLRREDLLSPACVSLEVTPGCGLQELQGIPSRHCMMYSESLLNPTQMQNDPNLQVFSADMAERSAGLAASLREKSDQHCLRTEMFGADGACFGLAGSARGDVEKFLQQVGLSVEEISKLGAQAIRPVLAPLQKLQAFAAGNAEKYAAEVFAALHNQGGQAAVDDLLDGLNDAKLIEAVVGKARAQRSSPNAIRVQQEQEAVKLLSHKWKSYQVEEAKRWLLRFLLGRASFQAKVLLNFYQESQGQTGPWAEQRFQRASELLPKEGWTSGWWVRATLVGIELNLDEIARSSAELETLVAKYKEAL
ncbi:unnamed protein product [Durusdinium trenchii]|uniref:Inositol-pentakisphosphate 2-kinase n=1 Tax=Durusdinium trenchii TaxID=1381693 RepID=A0ABP0JZG9_9DINO